MFRKIDKFVFLFTLADYLVRFVMLITIQNDNLRPIIGIISLMFSLAIFIRFFRDKNYKWSCFLGYAIIQSIVSVMLEFMFIGFAMMGRGLGLYLGFLTTGIICSFTGGFLYEYFKKVSYKKIEDDGEELQNKAK